MEQNEEDGGGWILPGSRRRFLPRPPSVVDWLQRRHNSKTSVAAVAADPQRSGND
jgi:hypothetical protein